MSQVTWDNLCAVARPRKGCLALPQILNACSRRPSGRSRKEHPRELRTEQATRLSGRRGTVQIRILVVDDEQDNCDYLKLILGKEGYEVTTLTDPTQTIEVLKQDEFHLVILDMMMPQMSGAEVLQHIRKIDSDIAVV